MHPDNLTIKIGLAACLFTFSWQVASPQKRSPDNTLANFEKSLDRGSLNEIDRPLLDYAIAHPNDPKALELLARLRLRQGRLPEAKSLYQRVLKLDPSSVPAKINSGRIAYAAGQQDEARQFLAGVEQSASLSPATQMELAAALLLVGETQRAANLAEKLPVSIRSTKALPLLASVYLKSGRRDDVGRLLPMMKKASSIDAALALQCADVVYSAGLFREAVDLLRSLPAKTQSDPKVLGMLGRLEVFTKDIPSAREHLKRAATLDPNSPDVLSAQAFLESASGNNDEAFKLLAKAREAVPNSPAVLADYVVVAMRAGKPSEAVDAAKVLLATEPDNPEFEYLFGAASLQNGDIGAAQETLERYVQKRPADSRGCLALGMAYAAQRDKFDVTRKQLSHCVEIDPANTEARYQLGVSYKSQGENKQAIEQLDVVVKQSPNYAMALRDLGSLYLENGDDAKARELLERAVTLSPSDPDIHFQLIRLYNRIGETALAKQHIEIFQKLKGPWGKSAQ